MSRVKPKVGDEVFWEDDTGKLQKGTVGGVDKSEVLLMETYTIYLGENIILYQPRHP